MWKFDETFDLECDIVFENDYVSWCISRVKWLMEKKEEK